MEVFNVGHVVTFRLVNILKEKVSAIVGILSVESSRMELPPGLIHKSGPSVHAGRREVRVSVVETIRGHHDIVLFLS